MKKSISLLLLILILISLVSCVVEPEPTIPPLVSGRQTVQGVIQKVEDLTPEGLFDAPRNYKINVLLESGETVDVTYTAYPPTPEDRPIPKLDFEGGELREGDWIIATGTYDPNAKLLMVSAAEDSIETVPVKP